MSRKRCLIIGASGDIGASVARGMAIEGYQITGHYYSNEQAMIELEEELSSHWDKTIYGNLATEQGIHAFLKCINEDYEAVVFCSGHTWTGLFQEMTEEEMKALHHLHVHSLWRITKHVLPSMIHNKAGKVVVVSSVFGEVGASTEVVYSSVKGAQISFVKALAREVAPSGIRVNAVTPGLIETKINCHLSQAELGAIEEEIPMGRSGMPREVSDAVQFLIKNESSYMTGQILRIDGGWY